MILQASHELDKLEKSINAIISNFDGTYEKIMKEVGRDMVNESKINVPSRTGRLSRSPNFIFDKKELLSVLTTKRRLNKSNVWYARMVEADRIIKAKNHEYLTFRVNGNWVRVRQVAVRGRPFMRPIFNEYFPETGQGKGYKAIQEAFLKYLNEEFK